MMVEEKILVPTDVVRLADAIEFARRAHFHNKHALKLFYFLSHAQSCSYQEAARALKISPALLYNRILPENPAFLSEIRSVNAFGAGGQERRIIISSEGKDWIPPWQTVAEREMPQECQQLRIDAGRRRKEVSREESRQAKRREKAILVVRKKRGAHNLPMILRTQARLAGMTEEELEEAAEEKIDGGKKE